MKVPNHNTTDGPQWDDEILWQSIETELDQDDKQRAGYLWFWGAIALFAIMGTCIFAWKPHYAPERNIATQIVKDTAPRYHISKIPTVRTVDNSQPLKSATTKTRATGMLATFPKNNQAQRDLEEQTNRASSMPFSSRHSSVPPTRQDITEIKQSDRRAPLYIESRLMDTKVFLELRRIESIPYCLVSTSGSRVLPKPSIELSEKVKKTSKIAWVIENSLAIPYLDDSFDAHIAWHNLLSKKEKALFATSHRMLIDIPLYSYLSLRSGIAIDRLECRLDAYDRQSSTTTIQADSAYVSYFIDGDRYYSGHVQRTHVIETKYRVYNRYTQVSIPLSMAYTMPLGKNKLISSIGLSFSMYTHLKGYSLSDVDKVRELSHALDGGGWNLGVQSMISSVVYRAHMVAGYSLEAGITGNIGLKPIRETIESNNTYARKYHTIGLTLGIHKHF